jgi:hypothetical protein
MKEQEKDFIEPVVLVRVPFKMVRDVARETVVRTHALVVRLTGGTEQEDTSPLEVDSRPVAAESR